MIFWAVALCSILAVFQHFRGMLVHSHILHGATAQIIDIHIARKSQILLYILVCLKGFNGFELSIVEVHLGQVLTLHHRSNFPSEF
jgi:hypothetical protein